MYKGIYIAASGAITRERELSVITKNIANAATHAYKKEKLSFSSFLLPSTVDASYSEKVMTEESGIITDFSQGGMTSTGDPFDLALEGNGFFALEGNRYTRKGSFGLDGEGYLISSEGYRVLGDDGNPLKIPSGRMDVNEEGFITVKGTNVGRINVVDFPKPYNLLKVGDGLYLSRDNAAPVRADARVVQGTLEGSNVNIIQAMVEMMRAVREVEAYQKMMRAFDENAGKAINEIGRI
ncbi:flagellar basal-body rod protein FlgG [bacterium BMS3Bbin06]|nr:flagellar basal-body rod protein FlgG [bacterium BMS3Abin08]GBE35149.1 flagellar basal-body rod protein FlgG [bacterium BMS3Bbin06]HDO36453.1 flagellar basal-body rod protein FlgF [Nitrospirota bacterium]HDY70042.1 flagellar basal-body rod protein FlgF [Nitrospirota bacterium]